MATKRSPRKSPSKISPKRVKNARPFASSASVKQALIDYKSGKSIGFSRISSLKAMGLLPRADGTYRVSNKYK